MNPAHGGPGTGAPAAGGRAGGRDVPAVALEGVTYAYPSDWLGPRRPVLSPLDLHVRAGEAFGFLGHNGAGKTTTIKLLLDLVRPTSGRAEIFGRPVRDPESRRGVGYMPEHPYFYDHLTVRETVELFAVLAGVPRAGRRDAVGSALESVGLGGREDTRLRHLSKGLTQRVALAQALVGRPRLLVLDEPFSGLDPIGRKEFREIFASLKRDGVTLFLCSHVLPDVRALCDRVSILSGGSLRGVFDLSALPPVDSLGHEVVFRDGAGKGRVTSVHPDRKSAEEAVRSGLAAGRSLETFGPVEDTLENLFVGLVTDPAGSGREAAT